MKVVTLRRRLSLRYFLLLALTFTLLGIGVYDGLVWGLQRNLDAGLLSQADSGARTVVAALDRYNTDREVAPETPLVEENVLREALLTSGRYAQLVDREGVVVAATPVLRDSPLPTPPSQVLSALNGKPAYATIETPGSQKVETYSAGQESLRTIFYPVHSAHGINHVLEVATPVLGVTEALENVRLILCLVTPVLLLIAAIAGSRMINGVLARVDEIARTARHIGAQSLDERLPERGPDEIGQLGETFNEMLDRLSLAFERMRQFTADASHELKTPLTSIRGDAEVGLMRPRSSEEYQEILGRVVEGVERMSEIVESLLLLARADAHSVPLHLELLEVDDVVDEVLSSCRDPAERAGIHLTCDVPPGLLIQGDAVFLRQMLGNLVGNALKYTAGGDQVWVRAEKERESVKLVVEDTGVGIAPEHRAHIFDRFYRVDSSHSSATGGSGLGLAIARAIAMEHGGDITVGDGPGGGAAFTVTLPMAPAELDETPDDPDPIELLL